MADPMKKTANQRDFESWQVNPDLVAQLRETQFVSTTTPIEEYADLVFTVVDEEGGRDLKAADLVESIRVRCGRDVKEDVEEAGGAYKLAHAVCRTIPNKIELYTTRDGLFLTLREPYKSDSGERWHDARDEESLLIITALQQEEGKRVKACDLVETIRTRYGNDLAREAEVAGGIQNFVRSVCWRNRDQLEYYHSLIGDLYVSLLNVYGDDSNEGNPMRRRFFHPRNSADAGLVWLQSMGSFSVFYCMSRDDMVKSRRLEKELYDEDAHSKVIPMADWKIGYIACCIDRERRTAYRVIIREMDERNGEFRVTGIDSKFVIARVHYSDIKYLKERFMEGEWANALCFCCSLEKFEARDEENIEEELDNIRREEIENRDCDDDYFSVYIHPVKMTDEGSVEVTLAVTIDDNERRYPELLYKLEMAQKVNEE